MSKISTRLTIFGASHRGNCRPRGDYGRGSHRLGGRRHAVGGLRVLHAGHHPQPGRLEQLRPVRPKVDSDDREARGLRSEVAAHLERRRQRLVQDQTFSKSLANEAGESSAENGGKSGGARQSYFESQFQFTSTTADPQEGAYLTVSPDRGDGARMSWVKISDTPTGLALEFSEYKNGGCVYTPIANGLDRTGAHAQADDAVRRRAGQRHRQGLRQRRRSSTPDQLGGLLPHRRVKPTGPSTRCSSAQAELRPTPPGPRWQGLPDRQPHADVGADGAGAVHIHDGDKTMTLDADCETDTTIGVPKATRSTATTTRSRPLRPSGSSFSGAVVQNDGTAMNVKNLKIEGGLPNNCVAVFNGVAFMNAGGSIKNVTLNNIGQTTGCQSGRAIVVWNTDTSARQSVAIENNTVTSYNKNGIDVRGNVDAKITGNTVTGKGPIDYIAQNGIVLIGASALIEGNTISGNSYTPDRRGPTGILVIDATGVKKKQNTLSGNEIDFDNCGRGGGKTSA